MLFAEDNEDHAFLIRRSLASLGAELTHVADGEDALATLNAWQGELPDLVLLDMNMPRMSGLEVLEGVRASARLSHLPVVIFSTSRLPADLERAYAAKANSYVAKPASFQEFREMLAKLGTYWTVLNMVAQDGSSTLGSAAAS
ncbi:MAG TPA: response regulator [Deinococcales bacterium]|nr:response regulator [Deinococcales bacterium]